MSPLAAKILAATLLYLHTNGCPCAGSGSSFGGLRFSYFDYVEVEVRLSCRHGIDLDDDWSFKWDMPLREWAAEAAHHVR